MDTSESGTKQRVIGPSDEENLTLGNEPEVEADALETTAESSYEHRLERLGGEPARVGGFTDDEVDESLPASLRDILTRPEREERFNWGISYLKRLLTREKRKRKNEEISEPEQVTDPIAKSFAKADAYFPTLSIKDADLELGKIAEAINLENEAKRNLFKKWILKLREIIKSNDRQILQAALDRCEAMLVLYDDDIGGEIKTHNDLIESYQRNAPALSKINAVETSQSQIDQSHETIKNLLDIKESFFVESSWDLPFLAKDAKISAYNLVRGLILTLREKLSTSS